MLFEEEEENQKKDETNHELIKSTKPRNTKESSGSDTSDDSISSESSQGTTRSKSSQNLSESEPQARSLFERPAIKLSVRLLETYKEINKKYYEKKRKKELQSQGQGSLSLYNNGYDDENYNYVVKENEIFAGLYQIVCPIGEGSFGQVVQAYDLENQQYVAIKIIKSKSAFYRQGLIEKQILEKLNQADPEDKYHVIRLIDSFKFRNHLCFVFELLSLNLYEVLKKTKLKGLSIVLVKQLALQIVETLQFLKSKKARIIHCDLKPENILLVNPRKVKVKIIDFGSSCEKNQKIHTYIQSRFYRSPEILLKMDYSYGIDMWSFGCILVELRTGKPLFPGRNEFEQMVRIVELLGIPPDEILNNAPGTSKFFEKDLNNKWVLKNIQNKNKKIKIKMKKRNLFDILRIPQINSRKFQNKSYQAKYVNLKNNEKIKKKKINIKKNKSQNYNLQEFNYSMIYEHLQFRDLILKILNYNPRQRTTPTQVMNHPFFKPRYHKNTQTTPIKLNKKQTDQNPPKILSKYNGYYNENMQEINEKNQVFILQNFSHETKTLYDVQIQCD
ncbi:serine/threonine-protein kinase minibrain [Anaeramoeba flamelloides]|uniref:Serine/threonine-protein kinase minibrain n=1 Tax=Anaeramoeba flamelloides TaxID=1746091 RepID=A0AAV8AET5_9EUKA|nr:serine/threonine-protein kinase minibrain [Anaeramoeba flamelloides]